MESHFSCLNTLYLASQRKKNYPQVHPPHTSAFTYAFSLKEQAFHRMFFRNKSEVYF